MPKSGSFRSPEKLKGSFERNCQGFTTDSRDSTKGNSNSPAIRRAVTEDGYFELDEKKIAAREKAMVDRLLASDEPVSVIVLGAAHDLAKWIDDPSVEYKRIELAMMQGD